MENKKPPTPAQWDERYRDDFSAETLPVAVRVLTENIYLLPTQGRALDLACGRGGNALLLAQRGLQVQAWDYSEVAIDQLKQFAMQQGVEIEADIRDVVKHPPEPNTFNVVVVSRFLDRTIMPELISAVAPGGILFYQTFVQEKVDDGVGPSSSSFLLQPNELLKMASSLRILVYREEGLQGDAAQGFRNEALLVAQKPA